ncbi:MAG: glycine cleavage system protein GcvH [Phycisphaerales bacterium]|nr:glycine cleavage system protein GcvH [Phycisphaerales bacterium]
MEVPADRRYTKTHEWFKADGDIVTIGITRFAADELTDITYVQLPAKGAAISAGKPFGEIESVKATSDLYSAIDGTVVEVNTRLDKEPELVNNDSFGNGWMIKARCSNPAQLNNLMDASAYLSQTGAK